MKILKYVAVMCICCSSHAESASTIQGQRESARIAYQYKLVTPESMNWNTSLHPDLPSIKKETMCPAILESFQNMGDTKPDTCERKFDSSLGFENINWVAMPNSVISDDLLKEISRAKIPNPVPYSWTEDIRNKKIQQYLDFYRRLLASDSSVVSQSSFDLDNDGKEDLVYKIKTHQCDVNRIDGTQQTKPIEPHYISLNSDGSLKSILSNGPVAIDGVLFRYSGQTFIGRSATYYTQGAGKHIAIHPIFPRSSGSHSNVGASALCIIEESR